MPATSKCRPLAGTLLAEFDGLSRSFTDELRRQRERTYEAAMRRCLRARGYRIDARHARR